MINAAEQVFELCSLIWLADLDGSSVILMIHDHGWWRGWPDEWAGQGVADPYPMTERGFAYLIDRVKIRPDVLGRAIRPEENYQTAVNRTESGIVLHDHWGREILLRTTGLQYWSVLDMPDR